MLYIGKCLKENTSNITLVCLSGGFIGDVYFLLYLVNFFFFQIIYQISIFSWRNTGSSLTEYKVCGLFGGELRGKIIWSLLFGKNLNIKSVIIKDKFYDYFSLEY